MSRRSFPPLEGDFTRALLRSAQGDEPSNAAYAKAAAALGVGVGLGLSASVPPAAIAAGAAGLAGAARWSTTAIAKVVALCVSGALLVGGGALLLRGPAVPSAHGDGPKTAPAGTAAAALAPAGAVVAAPVRAELANAAAQVGAPAGAPDAARFVAAAPEGSSVAARVAAVPAARRSARSAARPSSGSSLAEQVQSLDRARVALGSGDAGAALSEISHYRKAWPKGVFLTEASVLEIEALAARGQRARAASLASAFVSTHPDSPQAERLRALIPAETR